MGPYTKTRDNYIEDGWGVLDGDGEVIACAQTETLIDYIMAALLVLNFEPPNFPIGVAISPEDDDGPDTEPPEADAGPAG